MHKKLLSILVLLLLITNPVTLVAETVPEPLTPSVCTELSDVKKYACDQVGKHFGEQEWQHFDDIISRESRWKCNAQNPHTSAYGLGQFLNSTWKLVGYTKTDDCFEQVNATIAYIKKTYSTPQKAVYFHNVNNWY